MVTKKAVEKQFVPMADDGWWESVLADEHHFAPVTVRPQPKPAVPMPAPVPAASRAQSQVLTQEFVDWGKARIIYEQDQIIDLPVSGFNRGGLLVEGLGLQGFVPYSHLVEMNGQTELERERILEGYVGRSLRLKVIECVPEEGRIVFSERAARSESGCRNRLFTSLQQGMCVTGEVTNITDFGVFIDLGGVEGLIHISELSWGRVEHPSHIVSLGQKIDVQVLDVAPERCRVALSLKRLFPNPWETVQDRYAVNDIVPGTVTTVVSFGAFARLEEGLEGLIHVSQIKLPEGKMVRDILASGQKINVRILQIDPPHQRLGLSMLLEY